MTMIDQMLQGCTVGLGLMSWALCVGRIGDMGPATHRAEAIGWHLAAAGLGLWLAGAAVMRPGDPVAMLTATGLLAFLWLTQRDWQHGPPPWAWRQGAATPARGVLS